MQEITRVRAFPCATRIPAEDEPEEPFAALSDDELGEAAEVLRAEAIRRIGGMMAALNPHELTFGECRDLFKLLKSFMRSRGGPG